MAALGKAAMATIALVKGPLLVWKFLSKEQTDHDRTLTLERSVGTFSLATDHVISCSGTAVLRLHGILRGRCFLYKQMLRLSSSVQDVLTASQLLSMS